MPIFFFPFFAGVTVIAGLSCLPVYVYTLLHAPFLVELFGLPFTYVIGGWFVFGRALCMYGEYWLLVCDYLPFILDFDER